MPLISLQSPVAPFLAGPLADGGFWNFSLTGPLSAVVWALGALVGYLVFMAMNPLRGYLADSYDLLREKGHGGLVILVAALSMAGFALDWWRQVPPGSVPEWGSFSVPQVRSDLPDVLAATLRPVAGVFGVAVSGSELGFGSGARNVVLTLATGLLAVAIGFLVQFFLLLFLYLRVTMPGRLLKVGNLVDLSVRRVGTLWPVLLGCWIFWSVPVAFGFGGWLRLGWSIAFTLGFVILAFLEVAVLGKNRPLREAVTLNFASWRKRGGRTLWFVGVACVHGLALFLVASLFRTCVPPGTWFSLGFGLLYGFIRAFVVVWLLGAWVILWAD